MIGNSEEESWTDGNHILEVALTEFARSLDMGGEKGSLLK